MADDLPRIPNPDADPETRGWLRRFYAKRRNVTLPPDGPARVDPPPPIPDDDLDAIVKDLEERGRARAAGKAQPLPGRPQPK